MKLSVVIPTRNEEGCIKGTVEALHYELEKEKIPHEILVINDGSKDKTQDILNELQRKIPTFRSIFNSAPNGFGLAVRKGLDHFTGDLVAIYMADASDLPSDLVRYYREIQLRGVDCLFGTRFHPDSKVYNYPPLKLMLNRAANFFLRVLFGLPYNDLTNAFKMYRAEVINGIRPLISPHFNLTVEMPLKAIVRGYSYHVIPNNWINRKTGASKLKIKEMGSRYLFIALYCLIERWLSQGDYRKK